MPPRRSARSCTDPNDKMLVHLDTLDELGGRLRTMTDDELEALALLGERSNLKCSFGKQGSWRDDGKERAVNACIAANDARTAAIAAVTQPAISNVLGALVREVATAAGWRRHEGRVTFHDLLVIARNLLRDDPRVRAALADHYRVLLLDEFQDTDPLQIDLAMRIGGTAVGAELPASWSDITPRPGALFVVGDPKQSIYRFRRADIELYGQVVDTLTEDVLELTESFRSRPGIIDWVNATLGALDHARRRRPAGRLLAVARVPARGSTGSRARCASRWCGPQEVHPAQRPPGPRSHRARRTGPAGPDRGLAGEGGSRRTGSRAARRDQ